MLRTTDGGNSTKLDILCVSRTIQSLNWSSAMVTSGAIRTQRNESPLHPDSVPISI